MASNKKNKVSLVIIVFLITIGLAVAVWMVASGRLLSSADITSTPPYLDTDSEWIASFYDGYHGPGHDGTLQGHDTGFQTGMSVIKPTSDMGLGEAYGNGYLAPNVVYSQMPLGNNDSPNGMGSYVTRALPSDNSNPNQYKLDYIEVVKTQLGQPATPAVNTTLIQIDAINVNDIQVPNINNDAWNNHILYEYKFIGGTGVTETSIDQMKEKLSAMPGGRVYFRISIARGYVIAKITSHFTNTIKPGPFNITYSTDCNIQPAPAGDYQTVQLKWTPPSGAKQFEWQGQCNNDIGSNNWFSTGDPVDTDHATIRQKKVDKCLYKISAEGTVSTDSVTVDKCAASAAIVNVPVVPKDFSISAYDVDCHTLNLFWQKVDGASKYYIYNADNADQPIAAVNQSDASNNMMSWQVTGLNGSTEYRYFVKAVNDAGASAATETKSYSTNACPVNPTPTPTPTISPTSTITSTPTTTGTPTQSPLPLPTIIDLGKPQNVSLAGTSSSSVLLKWDAVSGAMGYDIYDCTGKYLTSTTNTNIPFDGLTCATEYCYYVIAKDGKGHFSSPSDKASAKTFDCGSVTPSTTDNTNITELVSTGGSLWFNIALAILLSTSLAYLIFRKEIWKN